MKTLIIDTSEKALVIALKNEQKEEIVVEDLGKSHSATLMPNIEKMLIKENININDIDIFGIIIGPGSFTGIRIGIAMVKGFCFGEKENVAKISSLKFIAMGETKKSNIQISIMDAKNNQVYLGYYGKEEFEIAGDFEYAVEKIKKVVTDSKEKVNICYLKDSEEVSKKLQNELKDIFEEVETEEISKINSCHKFFKDIEEKKAEIIDAKELVPSYLKKAQAQRMLEQKMLQDKGK